MIAEVDLTGILQTEVEKWTGWFMQITCACKRPSQHSVLGLMKDHGRTPIAGKTLAQVVGRLKCQTCAEKPRSVELWSNQGMVFMPKPAKIRILG